MNHFLYLRNFRHGLTHRCVHSKHLSELRSTMRFLFVRPICAPDTLARRQNKARKSLFVCEMDRGCRWEQRPKSLGSISLLTKDQSTINLPKAQEHSQRCTCPLNIVFYHTNLFLESRKSEVC